MEHAPLPPPTCSVIHVSCDKFRKASTTTIKHFFTADLLPGATVKLVACNRKAAFVLLQVESLHSPPHALIAQLSLLTFHNSTLIPTLRQIYQSITLKTHGHSSRHIPAAHPSPTIPAAHPSPPAPIHSAHRAFTYGYIDPMDQRLFIHTDLQHLFPTSLGYNYGHSLPVDQFGTFPWSTNELNQWLSQPCPLEVHSKNSEQCLEQLKAYNSDDEDWPELFMASHPPHMFSPLDWIHENDRAVAEAFSNGTLYDPSHGPWQGLQD